MDDPRLPQNEHFAALTGLARLNALARTSSTIWGELLQAGLEILRRPVRVLDLACGGGDLICRLEAAARESGRHFTFDGCDISPRALRFARDRARRLGFNPHFFELELPSDEIPDGYDYLISNLFLHHLDEQEAVELMANMARKAQFGFLISDLERSPAGYLLAAVVGRLSTTSRVVHHDAPASARAAFTPAEVREMADRAGLRNFQLSRCRPWRLLVHWKREPHDV